VSSDLRVLGESDKPGSRYDDDELSADLGEVIDQLRLADVTLVGWSMGCSVLLEYLRTSGAGVARPALVNEPIRLTQTDDFPWTMKEAELQSYLDAVARR
jgi:non-heme chloroperoxidase